MTESPDFGTVSILDIVYNDKGQTTKHAGRVRISHSRVFGSVQSRQ